MTVQIRISRKAAKTQSKEKKMGKAVGLLPFLATLRLCVSLFALSN